MRTIELQLLSDGWCMQLEAFALRGGRWRPVRFFSMFALLRHPTAGAVLFDTGYSPHFLKATARWPWGLYRAVTPVTLETGWSAVEQLDRAGVPPAEVRHVFVSHLHADHVGGLRDFPHAAIHVAREAWQDVAGRTAFGQLRRAFVPSLLPDDFQARAQWLEEKPVVTLGPAWAGLHQARDLLGDSSLLAVPLPGHAAGQHGLLFQSRQGPVLLAADGAWMRRAVRENAPPHPLTCLIQNLPQTRATLQMLHELHRHRPDLEIVPSHCPENKLAPSGL